MLSGTLVRKTGEPLQLYALMTREAGKIKLGPTDETSGGAQYLFAPFYEAWHREIPLEWMQAEEAARRSDSSGKQ
jgi:hypothetical protein